MSCVGCCLVSTQISEVAGQSDKDFEAAAFDLAEPWLGVNSLEVQNCEKIPDVFSFNPRKMLGKWEMLGELGKCLENC